MTPADFLKQGSAFDMAFLPSQASLTQQLVLPQLETILQKLESFRTEVDNEFVAQLKQTSKSTREQVEGEINLERYPLGFCRQIRDRTYARMLADVFFQDLIKSGLRLRKVFIFLRGQYFQNALQLGNFYFDVANDTVFIDKPKLDWAPVGKVDYENVDSWQRFEAVGCEYLKIEFYPNLIFPLAFPAMPFFAIRSNGSLEFVELQTSLFFKDLGQDMKLSIALLNDAAIMNKKLPDYYTLELERLFAGNLFQAFPLEYAPSSPQEILEGVVSEFQEMSRNPPANASATISAYLELITNADKQLRTRNLIPPRDELQRLRDAGLVQNEPEKAVTTTLE